MDFQTRKAVRDRAGDRCEYCRADQKHEPIGTFPIDHVIARQHGGETEVGNLCLSCLRCNRHKGPNIATLDPDTGQLTRLYNPRMDDWDTHFEWDGPLLVGKTSIGRGTIHCLNINDPLAVTLRSELMANGEFP